MDVNLPLDPPVNNNLQITLYDKLDQVTFEKIRVANTQLDSRLLIQERILNKHRRDIEKVHQHQSQRLRREVKKIRQKKPDYVFDDSDVSTQSRSRITSETGRQRCLSEPPSNLSHCRRYYAHHFNLKDSIKHEEEKHDKKDFDRDFCNLGLRLYFLNMMNVRQKDRSESVDQEDNLGLSFDSRHGEGLPDLGISNCERHTPRKYTTQVSSEESENDDVFDISHNRFRTNIEHFKQKGGVDCLTEVSEDDVSMSDVVDDTLTEIKTKRKRRRNNTTVRHRSSKASDADILQYGQGLRKTKRAFEKIFAGLL